MTPGFRTVSHKKLRSVFRYDDKEGGGNRPYLLRISRSVGALVGAEHRGRLAPPPARSMRCRAGSVATLCRRRRGARAARVVRGGIRQVSSVPCPRVRECCPCPALRTRPTANSRIGGWEATVVSTSSTPLPAKGCDLCTTNHNPSVGRFVSTSRCSDNDRPATATDNS